MINAGDCRKERRMQRTTRRRALGTICAVSALSSLLWSCGRSPDAAPGEPHREPLPEESGPKKFAKALSKVDATVPELQRSDWLNAHWKTPVAHQGDAPAEWTELEKSLDPEKCAICHPSQAADWRGSRHSKAMGPGIMGQLVDNDDKFNYIEGCQRCHAPLSEQYPVLANNVANERFDPELRAHGLSCAACHVRKHEVRGPPSGRPIADNTPHGGFVPRDEYESPTFCATCHDFKPHQKRLNGKLFQETSEEWRRTSFAAAGKTCQSCHMPDKRHLFRGIHDKDTVRDAVDVRVSVGAGSLVGDMITASLTLTNTGAGHRMPTYTPPQITLILEQVDKDGNALAQTQRVGAVARRLSVDLKKELYDNRLLPGQSYTLDYQLRRARGSAAVLARVEVWPDEGYRRFYTAVLKNPARHTKGRPLLQEALKDSIKSRYELWRELAPLDD